MQERRTNIRDSSFAARRGNARPDAPKACAPNAAEPDEELMLLVAASSFIETASHVYTRNLIEYFRGDDEVTDWLEREWEPQELGHGEMLRSYLARVWPEFEWEEGYRHFFPDYTSRCTLAALERARGLEMVARCVVETGTATLYRAISDHARDPLLQRIARRISSDEVSHYRHFRRYFKKYQLKERHSRFQVLRALARRTVELRLEDSDCSLRHVCAQRYPERAQDARFVRATSARVRGLVRAHYPFRTGAKMLLKPLELPARVEALVRPPLVLAGRWFAFA